MNKLQILRGCNHHVIASRVILSVILRPPIFQEKRCVTQVKPSSFSLSAFPSTVRNGLSQSPSALGYSVEATTLNLNVGFYKDCCFSSIHVAAGELEYAVEC